MSDKLNDVKSRFLPMPENAVKGLEHEAKITDFEILKELGLGSHGNVYLARHKETKAEYAIKAIDKKNKAKLYFKDFEVIYKAHHPNIVKIFGHFEDNNYIYFIMEYFSKGNIYNLLPTDKKKRLSAKYCASLIKDVICAVYFLHNMKPPIILRNIEPENVLLSGDSGVLVAKLTDFFWNNYYEEFSIRKNIAANSITQYSAPEILQKKEYNEAADIWNIGVLLFELVTSTRPFQGENRNTVEENILKLNITWPKDINTDAKNLIMEILKLDPKQRLPLEDMLKHPFITKYIPDATKYLIKPEEGVQYKPFIVSKDNPKTWKPDKI